MLTPMFRIVLISSVFIVGACGGGGGGSSNTNNPPPINTTQSDFDQGIFRSERLFEAQCAIPRAGTNDAQGSTSDENNWLRSWSNNLYLWYDEIVDEDPDAFTTPAYFDLMRTFELTPTGAERDRFHFSLDTEEWERQSQTGVSAGYGANIILISATRPRRAVIASVEAGSPADLAGLSRGTVITAVDGEDLVNGTNTTVLNAGLFPSNTGETHDFDIEDFDGSNPRSVTMVSADVVEETVPVAQIINTSAGPVGYMVFTSFIGPSEARLVNEIDTFATAGITELVLDLRYNGGGFLDIASELAYMIAGPSFAQGRVFEQLEFNDKHPTTNPVTGASLAPDIFHTTTQGFSLASGSPLPTLSLNRVIILTTDSTASASESVINALRGIDFPVVLIGEPTTGKPYGFYPTDNCGTTYFTIQFRGINAKGFGDYADGFIPSENPIEEFEVQGCDVPDDFTRQLGDTDEALLTTALGYVSTSDCSARPNRAAPQRAQRLLNAGDLPLAPQPRIPGRIGKR